MITGADAATADDINNHGHILGCCTGETIALLDFSRSFVYHPQTNTTHDVGGLSADYISTRGSAINDLGQVVGTATHSSSSNFDLRRAWIWEAGVIRDLNARLPPDSGWVLTEAADINERGEIIGRGIHNGQPSAFLMTPETCLRTDDVDGDGNRDNDGDWLCDSWELNGIDVNGDGSLDLNLAAESASARHANSPKSLSSVSSTRD